VAAHSNGGTEEKHVRSQSSSGSSGVERRVCMLATLIGLF
jgi:hypothetical protein